MDLKVFEINLRVFCFFITDNIAPKLTHPLAFPILAAVCF